MPNSGKYYLRLEIGGKVAGLAVWGYGVCPKGTAAKLFGGALGVPGYLELSRFLVYDWAPPNTASRFLAATHRLIRKHCPSVKALYTYAAGFQGLVGTIYQAAGYEHIGPQLCDSFLLIGERRLVHRVSLYNRYGKWSSAARDWQRVFPGSRQWCGYNFCYIYWLCRGAEREALRGASSFTAQPHPTKADLQIWTVDAAGVRAPVSVEYARTVQIVKLKSNRCARSIDSDAPSSPAGGGRCSSDPSAFVGGSG